MKLFTLAIALLSSTSSVLSIPVTDHGLVVCGSKDYCETSQVIVAKTYVKTDTDLLYSAHCDCDSCDYSVRASACLANHKTFYSSLVIDVNIDVVEIDKETIYFKCKQPTEYVQNSCEKYSFGYSSYPKGLLQ
jgi:hypothetical protein